MSRQQNILICLILLSILTSACEEVSAASLPYLTPCPPATNEYKQPVEQDLVNIYEEAVLAQNEPSGYNVRKQRALKRLINLMYQMSDSIDLPSNDRIVRITITYMSPELIQTIILNEYLHNSANGYSGIFPLQVQAHMNQIIERNEYLFFITVVSSKYSRNFNNNRYTTVNIPIHSLALTNTSDIDILSKHFDHNLEETIVLDKPVYGVISYMMAVVNVNNGCQPVLDKSLDKRIFLSVPYIRIDGTDQQVRPWEFKFTSLIEVPFVQNDQTFFPNDPAIDKCSPNKDALSSVDLQTEGYWEALARFIWYETISNP